MVLNDPKKLLLLAPISVVVVVVVVVAAIGCSKSGSSGGSGSGTSSSSSAAAAAAAAAASASAAVAANVAEPPAPRAYEELPPIVLPPLAKELETQARTTGDVNAAIELATWFLSGDGIVADAARAAALLHGACKKNVPGACGRLGHLYLQGMGVRRNVPYGVKLLEQSCSSGHDVWSCARIGVERIFAKRVPIDLDRGAKELKTACDGGSIYGCEALAVAMRASKEKADDDLQHRAVLKQRLVDAKKACSAKRHYECAEFGSFAASAMAIRGETSLSTNSADGWPVGPSNDERCGSGVYSACNMLADEGEVASSLKRLRPPCDAGDYRACSIIPILGEIDGAFCGKGSCSTCDAHAWTNPPNEHARLLEKGCRAGCMNACANWTEGMTTADEGSRAAHVTACEQGFASSCFQLAQAETDAAKAYALNERACPEVPRFANFDDIDADACFAAAEARREGRGTAKNTALATAFYERACPASFYPYGFSAKACVALGEQAEAAKHFDRALSLYASACQSEGHFDLRGCEHVRMLVTERAVITDPVLKERILKRVTNEISRRGPRQPKTATPPTATDGGGQ